MRHLGWFTLPVLIRVALAAPSAGAQEATKPSFTDAQLEQMAAPIALYPDALLMQVLMGATYPLEIVEADRWRTYKKGLSGNALEEALKGEDWDPSVKSLCTFPDVLARMSENLDWTRDLGDAFIGQKAALLDAVQRLRDKAYEAGNLKSSEQQVVTVKEEKIIVIESSSPEVVYVPTYSPVVVYGTWPYPTTYYAPLYAPPPPGYTAMAFTAGVAVGGALYGNCNWGWGHSDVDIDIDHYNNFNQVTNNNYQKIQNTQGNKAQQWQHNPEHRQGVNYRDGQTAQKYGGSGAGSRVSSAEARGFGQGGRGAGSAANAGGRAQPASQDAGRGAAGGGREAAQGRGAAGAGNAANRTNSGAGNAANRTNASASQRGRDSGGGAFAGSRNPGGDQAASSRGSASRGTPSYGGGGGRRGGGGRGR